ncbi:MAG TPA: hypothetical protein VFP33_03690 [Gallionella sp.]|nr:hypothetical protein [Gallionella sp.]
MAALVPPEELHSTAFHAMSIASGACWIVVYALIIRRGYLDRSYGMPLVAVCVNISWEFIFTFLIPHERPQNYINAGWLLLDLFILVQLLLFWRSDFPKLDKMVFYPFTVAALLASFGLIYTMAVEFDHCGAYSAFGQNFLMSILFMIMLFQRNSLLGQSIYIGMAKLAGTALASLSAWFFVPLAQQSAVLQYLFLTILFFDLSYVAAIFYIARKQRVTVWTRL